MKCIIPGINIKIFARAVHSLARVGDELYVEPSSSGVFFRTVNSSRSAFGSFFFKSDFFSLYSFKVPDVQLEDSFKCKVAMKACLNAFKSVNTIERLVEKCRLIIDPERDRLIVDMTCKHDFHKTYNLSFIECETLQAVFDKTKCPFGTSSHSRLLCDAFINFQSNQEEVTLEASPQKMLIRNYVDDDPDPAKSIHTELSLDALEFDSYDINESVEVTFCLKEVRSLLSFSEPSNLPVSVVFSKPGSPIIFSVENSVFEANFVLATLSSTTDASQTPQHSAATASSQTSRLIDKTGNRSHPQSRPSETIHNLSEARNHPRRSSEDINEFSSRLTSDHMGVASSPNTSQVGTRRLSAECLQASSAKKPPPIASNNQSTKFQNGEGGGGSIEGEGRKRKGDDDVDVIPGTPPQKRKRFFFRRCFEPTFDANNISAFAQILAEDSDEEF